MHMKKIRFSYIILLCIFTVCFCSISLSFAANLENNAENESNSENINTVQLNLAYIPHIQSKQDIIQYNIYQYQAKNDLLGLISNPYITQFTKSLNKEKMYSYALPYHSNLFQYDTNITPFEKYRAVITTFTLKSMNIFDVNDYDTAIHDAVYSILINSILGFTTKNLIGLNIWSGTDYYGVTGFQAIIRPFKNLYAAYSYLTDQHYNRSIIKLNYGYKKYSNIAFKTMNTFSEQHINTTLGIEWQFYF